MDTDGHINETFLLINILFIVVSYCNHNLFTYFPSLIEGFKKVYILLHVIYLKNVHKCWIKQGCLIW